ncbi:MAG: FtsQ-type POTRA domain-containing protein [Treponema sp.]|nr:FtsQ-type POTRA domain-containing protein [Treponema sp.]
MAYDYAMAETPESTWFEKALKTFVILVIIFMAVVMIWFFGISPFRAFSNIDVVDIKAGAEKPLLASAGGTGAGSMPGVSTYFGLSREDILSKAGITKESSFFSTNARAAEKALLGFIPLNSVKVNKLYPDRLEIVLEGRQAAASAIALLDGKKVPVLFDKEGVIFKIGSDAKESQLPYGLPLISGLIIENPVPGTRLPVIFTPLWKELEKIETTAPELLAAVSEIRINPKSFDSYDLDLFPVYKNIKVRLSEINEDLLRYALLMVDVLASREPEIRDIDFRSGIASYIPKEVSSEQ